MEDSSPANTSISTTTKMDLDSKYKRVDSKIYRGIVGSLLYLTTSKPSIMYTTYLYARFQIDPKESNLIISKRIFRYLKGTQNLGLWYHKYSGFDLIGYSDLDYDGCRIYKNVLQVVVTYWWKICFII